MTTKEYKKTTYLHDPSNEWQSKKKTKNRHYLAIFCLFCVAMASVSVCCFRIVCHVTNTDWRTAQQSCNIMAVPFHRHQSTSSGNYERTNLMVMPERVSLSTRTVFFFYPFHFLYQLFACHSNICFDRNV